MSKIVEIIQTFNVRLALKNIFSKINEIVNYINNNLGGTVIDVTASSPLNSTGGDSPNLTIDLADNSNDGYLSSSDWNMFNNKQNALGFTPENLANKGVSNGYAPLESDAKIDASYLPSYVSDVLEYANLAAFPVTGSSDKIYIALDTNKVYRWSGSTYIEVAANSGVWGAITGTLANQTDLITYLSNYTKKFLNKTSDSSTITGTTSNVLLDSLLIPENTFEVGLSKIITRNKFSGTAGIKTTRLYINTTNSLAGATLIGTYTAGTGALSVDMARYAVIKSTTSFEVFNSSSTVINSEAQSSSAVSTITYDATIDNYLICAIQLGSASDSAINSFMYLEV